MSAIRRYIFYLISDQCSPQPFLARRPAWPNLVNMGCRLALADTAWLSYLFGVLYSYCLYNRRQLVTCISFYSLLVDAILITVTSFPGVRAILTTVLIIEIIDIECGLLSRVSQKIVATKWRIYKGKLFCQIGPLSRDRARILYLIIIWY